MKNKKRWLYRHRGLAITVLLIILLNLSAFIAIHQINTIEEEYCFDTLEDESNRLSKDILTHIQSDRNQLEVIANIISGYNEITSEEVKNLLKTYESKKMISHLEILLPDNTVLLKDGTTINAENVLSFIKESEMGCHITDIEQALTDKNSLVLRHYVPITKDGKITAMLYGVINLKDLPDLWTADAYDGKAAIYVIDGNTGDFIVDTWHKELGNIWGLGKREMKSGYTHEQLTKGVTNGDKGYVVFLSKTTGKYLYFYYTPTEINEWRIALSVPEDIVFQNAVKIKNILRLFTIFEAVCFLIYFMWMIVYVKNETNEKQRQLETIRYIYDVEKLLFTAHQKEENIEKALEKIADIAAAECTYFIMFQEDNTEKTYTWSRAEGFQQAMPDLRDITEPTVLYKENNLKRMNPQQYIGLERNGLESLMLTPIKDIDNHIVGILGAVNMHLRFEAPELLNNVALSFSMLCHNVKSFTIIKEMGEKDILTGLLNRNSFEKSLENQYRDKSSLACIYVDVNGLHELNNVKGHDAGDSMLRCVAGELQSRFGAECTYRLGGDEFIAFSSGRDNTTLLHLIQDMKKILKQKGYSVSVGISWKDNNTSMDDLVKQSEQKMYLEKKEYYERSNMEYRKELPFN